MALSDLRSMPSPLAAWKFRVAAGRLHTVTENTDSVQFDFVTNTLVIKVRQTVAPESFEQAYSFARRPNFEIEAIANSGEVVFGIKPLGIELKSHKLELAYGAGNECAMHVYTIGYDDLITGTLEPEAALPAASDDPRFPTPAEAVASLEEPEVLELDLEQEMRITPDNPDTDGDGVPDKLDKHPKDPKRH